MKIVTTRCDTKFALFEKRMVEIGSYAPWVMYRNNFQRALQKVLKFDTEQEVEVFVGLRKYPKARNGNSYFVDKYGNGLRIGCMRFDEKNAAKLLAWGKPRSKKVK